MNSLMYHEEQDTLYKQRTLDEIIEEYSDEEKSDELEQASASTETD